MNDKLWNSCGAMFPLHYQGDLFVTYNGVTWVLNEERWFNFCQEMANRGVNIFRWLGWNVWAWALGAKNLGPFLMDASGKYNLSVWNETYWQIAERMIVIMNYPSQKPGNTAPGITLDMNLFYQYTGDANDQAGSPFRNNTIGTTSLYDEANWQYAEAYMLRWFALGKKYKIVFGMGNELGADSLEFCYNVLRVMDRERVWPFSWGICAEVPSPGGNDVFKALPKFINDSGLFEWSPNKHIPEWECNVRRRVHKCGGMIGITDVFSQACAYFNCLPVLWIASDDGCMGPEGKPGKEWWYGAVKTLCTYRGTDALTFPWPCQKPIIGIEHLPDDEQWDIARPKQLPVFEAIGQAYLDHMGQSLENWKQWPDAWVEPVIVVPPGPGPVVDVPVVKPPFDLNGWWNNNHETVYASIIGIIVLVVLLILIF